MNNNHNNQNNGNDVNNNINGIAGMGYMNSVTNMDGITCMNDMDGINQNNNNTTSTTPSTIITTNLTNIENNNNNNYQYFNNNNNNNRDNIYKTIFSTIGLKYYLLSIDYLGCERYKDYLKTKIINCLKSPECIQDERNLQLFNNEIIYNGLFANGVLVAPDITDINNNYHQYYSNSEINFLESILISSINDIDENDFKENDSGCGDGILYKAFEKLLESITATYQYDKGIIENKTREIEQLKRNYNHYLNGDEDSRFVLSKVIIAKQLILNEYAIFDQQEKVYPPTSLSRNQQQLKQSQQQLVNIIALQINDTTSTTTNKNTSFGKIDREQPTWENIQFKDSRDGIIYGFNGYFIGGSNQILTSSHSLDLVTFQEFDIKHCIGHIELANKQNDREVSFLVLELSSGNSKKFKSLASDPSFKTKFALCSIVSNIQIPPVGSVITEYIYIFSSKSKSLPLGVCYTNPEIPLALVAFVITRKVDFQFLEKKIKEQRDKEQYLDKIKKSNSGSRKEYSRVHQQTNK